MLFESDRHEALRDVSWDEAAARDAIERIALDSTMAFEAEGLWPVHPLEHAPGTNPLRMLYYGATGVIWALDSLHRAGATAPPPDFSGVLPELLESNRNAIRPSTQRSESLLMGDAGILLLCWKLTPSRELAAQIASTISANRENPTREFMWGSPGTLLAALAMYELSGDEAWAELFREGTSDLADALETDSELGCRLFTQDLYGTRSRQLGAGHGFAGTVFPIVRGLRLLAPDEQAQWSRCIRETLTATALTEDGWANWPQSIGTPRPARTALLVQHCHGAPGIVNCLATLPDAAIDDLLIAAGELTWAAGPLKKGANYCHGTAGNGYALLKLFTRTQDSRWLERARAFAMHAIAQSERDLQKFGRRRYSLWTGDLGLAAFLWSCIQATDAFPTADVF